MRIDMTRHWNLLRWGLVLAIVATGMTLLYAQEPGRTDPSTQTATSTAPQSQSDTARQIATGPQRYARSIAAYEARDRLNPPTAGGTLFVGSSTFTRWKTIPEVFKEFTAANRAFGGSTLADQLYYADRMIIPFKPRRIVMYCGTNDIWNGASAESVFDNYEKLMSKLHKELPECRIYFISAVPAPVRMRAAKSYHEFNTLVEAHIRLNSYLRYVDAHNAFSDAEGNPDNSLYADDHLHPNDQGYEKLIPLIKAAIRADEAVAQPDTQPS